jgi:hypothetical protein
MCNTRKENNEIKAYFLHRCRVIPNCTQLPVYETHTNARCIWEDINPVLDETGNKERKEGKDEEWLGEWVNKWNSTEGLEVKK